MRKVTTWLTKPTINRRPEFHYVVNELKYLALIPPNCIETTYEAIKKETEQNFGQTFEKYFNYFDNQWLKKTGPAQISIFKQIEDRTTNFIESYHNQLKSKSGKHPSVITLIGKLYIVNLLVHV